MVASIYHVCGIRKSNARTRNENHDRLSVQTHDVGKFERIRDGRGHSLGGERLNRIQQAGVRIPVSPDGSSLFACQPATHGEAKEVETNSGERNLKEKCSARVSSPDEVR